MILEWFEISFEWFAFDAFICWDISQINCPDAYVNWSYPSGLENKLPHLWILSVGKYYGHIVHLLDPTFIFGRCHGNFPPVTPAKYECDMTNANGEEGHSYWSLTHWGRVTHIWVSKQSIIASDNGLSPGRRQAIIGTNAGILLIPTLGTNFSEILSKILTFSFKKMCLKVSSAKWRPFCLGLNVLRGESNDWLIPLTKHQ